MVLVPWILKALMCLLLAHCGFLSDSTRDPTVISKSMVRRKVRLSLWVWNVGQTHVSIVDVVTTEVQIYMDEKTLFWRDIYPYE